MIGAEQLKQEDLRDIKTITVKDTEGNLVGTIVALNLGDSIVIQAGNNITLEVDETNKTLAIGAVVPGGIELHADSHINDAIDRIPDATQLSAGLMSNVDKIKLDGIEEGANNYSHPVSHSLNMITETETLKIMTVDERTKLTNLAPVYYGTTPPSEPSKGCWWFDENVNRYKYWNDTDWIDPGAYV